MPPGKYHAQLVGELVLVSVKLMQVPSHIESLLTIKPASGGGVPLSVRAISSAKNLLKEMPGTSSNRKNNNALIFPKGFIVKVLIMKNKKIKLRQIIN